MIALATGTYTVLRGTTTNVFGDDSDAGTVVLTGVPVGLMEVAQANTRHADDRMQEVYTYRGRCDRGTDIRMGDQLVSESNATLVYQVTGTHQAENPILAQDRALDLERVPTS